MKPEPLKDKVTCLNCLNTPCNCGTNNSAFIKGDIKSAVEWLKAELESDYFRQFDFKAKKKVYELINKAFEDVIK